jgi:3-deoxy-manno-octulosonate cytidylyltransferase (CMP-KDO synthetase)
MNMAERFLGIIPARYHSTRFPGKPLAMLGGKPMILWTWDRASAVFSELLVATDDDRILATIRAYGGQAVMTSADHRTGTERCAEAFELYRTEHPGDFTHVVNIQGDEPLLDPAQLKELKHCLLEEDAEIATLVHPVASEEELEDPNIVKVVTDPRGRALYFSRSPVPFARGLSVPDMIRQQRYLKHIGIYGFRAEILGQLTGLEPSPLEQAESLEQLRWLENGYEIRTRVTQALSVGVDTPSDLEKVRRMIAHS